MDEQRIIDLEVKISHQEMAIEALQLSAYEQQKAIDALEAMMRRLVKRLQSSGDGEAEIGPANEKPPHY